MSDPIEFDEQQRAMANHLDAELRDFRHILQALAERVEFRPCETDKVLDDIRATYKTIEIALNAGSFDDVITELHRHLAKKCLYAAASAECRAKEQLETSARKIQEVAQTKP